MFASVYRPFDPPPPSPPLPRVTGFGSVAVLTLGDCQEGGFPFGEDKEKTKGEKGRDFPLFPCCIQHTLGSVWSGGWHGGFKGIFIC